MKFKKMTITFKWYKYFMIGIHPLIKYSPDGNRFTALHLGYITLYFTWKEKI